MSGTRPRGVRGECKAASLSTPARVILILIIDRPGRTFSVMRRGAMPSLHRSQFVQQVRLCGSQSDAVVSYGSPREQPRIRVGERVKRKSRRLSALRSRPSHATWLQRLCRRSAVCWASRQLETDWAMAPGRCPHGTLCASTCWRGAQQYSAPTRGTGISRREYPQCSARTCRS